MTVIVQFQNVREHIDLESLLVSSYSYWEKWTNLDTSLEQAINTIKNENERNFNRELLNRLKEKYSDVDININISTGNLIKALKGTSVDPEYLEKILREIQ